MNTSRRELVIAGQLTLIREVMNPKECRRFWKELSRFANDYENIGKTTRAIFDLLGIPDGHETSINRQRRGEVQNFHRDSSPVIIVNFKGEGMFDYAFDAITPEEATQSFESLFVTAGDVVIAPGVTEMYHRGRNTGGGLRQNIQIWAEIDSQFNQPQTSPLPGRVS